MNESWLDCLDGHQGFADAENNKMQLTAPANRSAAADLGVLRT